MRRAPSISLTPLERAWLEVWASRRSPTDRLSLRARVVLGASEGSTNRTIAGRLGIHPETVGRWRRRFALLRLEGVRRDAPRSGGRPGRSDRLVERIVRLMATAPGPSGGRWTTRTLARQLGVSHMAIHRVWRARDLERSEPRYSLAGMVPGPRVRIDLVGLYVGAPAHAIVFGVRASLPESRVGRTLPPLGISGAYASAVGPHLPPALAGFLLDIESGPAPPGHDFGASQAAPGLLVFLRALEEEQGLGATGLHIIFDRPLDLLPERVVDWLRSRSCFRPMGTAEGTTWTLAVDEWVRAFSGTVVHPDNLRDMGLLLEASASAGPDLRRGFSWTHGGRPDGAPVPYPVAPTPGASPPYPGPVQDLLRGSYPTGRPAGEREPQHLAPAPEAVDPSGAPSRRIDRWAAARSGARKWSAPRSPRTRPDLGHPVGVPATVVVGEPGTFAGSALERGLETLGSGPPASTSKAVAGSSGCVASGGRASG